jgi:uncharacterized protein YyaL (SSP411 family)
MSHPIFSNRLINEKSPYLLQHAHNPVDWYPWGEEAFSAARSADKPIFLSVGYATCHWCHVMEHESFDNPEIGELMNETFINIKVDREEMPEVDSIYMEFAQAMMSGGAGWPLNVILTPDLMPFFAATYLPPDSKHGFLGMRQLILRIHEIWHDAGEREQVIAQAGKIVDLFNDHVHTEGNELPTREEINEAAELLFKTADPIYGGTRGSPKFPIGYQACFLLRFSRKQSDSRALFYVEKTLQMMHRGGIYDHLGGGFSRYSIDERWQIPHFEKMLYDNAILARAYLETWEFTREKFYREVSEEILGYVLREMTDPQGGFYSAQDADTSDHEGLFYTWTWEEINRALGSDAHLFCEYYGVTPTGNFEGRNILHTPKSLVDFSTEHQMDPVALSNKLKEIKTKLWEIREKREHPLKDDKIITSWNGLMIYAFVEASRTFNSEKYLQVALKAANFIKNNLWKEGTLHRRWREGEARFEGCLDDYAYMIHACISLFEVDCGASWLEFAMQLAGCLNQDFKAEGGAFYFTNGKDPNLLLRSCEFYDGAEPSGNAIHAENLIRLYQITGIKDYLLAAEDILKAAKQHIDLYPPGACYHLMSLQRLLDHDAPTLIIALNEEETYRVEIARMLAVRFIPHKCVIWRRDSDEELRDLVPIARDKSSQEGKTTLYVCRQNRCEEPVTNLTKIWEVIEKL